MRNKYEYGGPSTIFNYALDYLSDVDQGVFGPTPLIDYLEDLGFPKLRAPELISIDSFEKLQQSLKNNDCMVLRLGRSHMVGSQFAIVKTAGRLKDFFLFDDEVFSPAPVEYNPKEWNNKLMAYTLLPTLTETSLVNLAFASGLVSEALQLDKIDPIYPPATSNSVLSFNFKPHSTIGSVLNHNQGQVEIDALFVGKRKGVETLFVIEAKAGNTHKSLAKHKLLYPILGIAPSVPLEIPIVPVYVKILSSAYGVHYHITECDVPDPRSGLVSFDELMITRSVHYLYPNHLLNK